MKDIILIGGGGHSVSVIDVIEQTQQFRIQGILDRPEKVGQKILGYSIIGTDEDIQSHHRPDIFFLITIGQIQSAEIRKKIFMRGSEVGVNWATVISPFAYVSKHAKIGAGTVVLHGAIINARAEVGVNCILNTKCLIEHEAIVGHHCHVATGAIVNGQCVVGDESFVGSASVMRQNSKLPRGGFIQAGQFWRDK